jgi:hypothetical protein
MFLDHRSFLLAYRQDNQVNAGNRNGRSYSMPIRGVLALISYPG